MPSSHTPRRLSRVWEPDPETGIRRTDRHEYLDLVDAFSLVAEFTWTLDPQVKADTWREIERRGLQVGAIRTVRGHLVEAVTVSRLETEQASEGGAP